MENSINKLIEKYFEGESSLQEEAQIRTYFQEEEVSDDLKAYAPLFEYFEEEKQSFLSDNFEEKLFQKIENQGKVVQMRSTRMIFLRVAAAVMILIGAFFTLQNLNDTTTSTVSEIDWEKYEPETSEEAYEVTREALQLLASKLSKGSKKASTQVSKVKKTNKIYK